MLNFWKKCGSASLCRPRYYCFETKRGREREREGERGRERGLRTCLAYPEFRESEAQGTEDRTSKFESSILVAENNVLCCVVLYFDKVNDRAREACSRRTELSKRSTVLNRDVAFFIMISRTSKKEREHSSCVEAVPITFSNHSGTEDRICS